MIYSDYEYTQWGKGAQESESQHDSSRRWAKEIEFKVSRLAIPGHCRADGDSPKGATDLVTLTPSATGESHRGAREERTHTQVLFSLPATKK